jgi:hypothetical protein
MDNRIILVVGIFFGGAVGLLVGLGLVFLRRRRDNKQEQAMESVPAPEPPPPPIPARNTPKDSVEILSVWRNERTGKLVALLEAKPLANPLDDRAKGKNFANFVWLAYDDWGCSTTSPPSRGDASPIYQSTPDGTDASPGRSTRYRPVGIPIRSKN